MTNDIKDYMIKVFQLPQYTLKVQLKENKQIHLQLTRFNNQMNDMTKYQQVLKYENICEEAQFFFETIQEMFNTCFSWIGRFVVGKGFVRIFYKIGMRGMVDISQKKGAYEEEEVSFTIYLTSQQYMQKQAKKQWFKNFKYQYLRNKNNYQDIKHKLNFLKFLIDDKSHQKSQKYNKFLRNLTNRNQKQLQQFNRIMVPFSLDSFITKQKYNISLMVSLKEKWLSLRKLQLRQCGIEDYDVFIIILLQVPNLKSLDLSRNRLTDKGVKYLSEGNFPCLQVLDLSRNQKIKAEGYKYLSQTKLPNLKKLFLRYNITKDEEIRYLSQAHFTKLQALILYCLSSSAARILCEAKFFKLKFVIVMQPFDSFYELKTIFLHANIEFSV